MLMARILFISPGPNPPNEDPSYDWFNSLSVISEGDVLHLVWGQSLDDLPEFLHPTFPVHNVGNFRYHLFQPGRLPVAIQRIAKLLFYLREGVRLNRKHRFDAIVTYGTNITGIAGVILKYLTGAKLITKVPGNPQDAFRKDTPKSRIGSAIKHFGADILLHLVCGTVDCIYLMYPWQLGNYPLLRNREVAVFPSFTPVHNVPKHSEDQSFLLCMGYPWYTKGFDILIRAFASIASRFPDHRLKIYGAGIDELKPLANGCDQVEFNGPVTHQQALELIANCSAYVLASRTEGTPRVLLEAMAAHKPIVASAVGGVPHYIHDNDNGLLFEPENVEQLAEKLTLILESPELRKRLGSRAYERLVAEFDERAHVRGFQLMLERVGIAPSKLLDSRTERESSSSMHHQKV